MSDRLSEIRARLDAATPGPWHLDDMSELRDAKNRPLVRRYEGEGGEHAFWEQPSDPDSDADGQVMAHAPDDIRWLLARVDRVLALHRPIDAAALDYGGRVVQVCAGCGQDDGNWAPWPCPTVRAITGGDPS